MRLLDKFILRNVLVPFFLCFFAFLAIWLVFDLSDHASDFIDGKVGGAGITYYYLSQLPQIALLSLPIGFLLALLFSLGKMSRSNEIIAMSTAGQSLSRLVAPLVIVGVLLSGVATWLNFQMAPQAESKKKAFFDQLDEKRLKRSTVIEAHLFPNRPDRRTWYVEEMPTIQVEDPVLYGLHIIQQDEERNIRTKWYAARATYDEVSRTWRLERGRTVQLDSGGNISESEVWTALTISDWSETPWRIASSNIDPDSLSVPELREYLEHNSDFPPKQLAPFRTQLEYRWALPWTSLLAVFLAVPLGIVYSRRGILSGVVLAIILFVAHNLLGALLLALGKGNAISPFAATWGVHVAFLMIGLYLFFLKATNRQPPSLLSWLS